MATDQTETVLYEVRLNAEQLKQQQEQVRTQQRELTKEIQNTRAAQKQLEADYKTGAKTQGQYAQEATALREQLRSQTQQQQAAAKTLDNLTKVQDNAAGSNDQLRAELALATAAYNALGKAERENSEEGKALQARTKALSLEISANEQAVNDHRRSVGNYKGGFQDLVKEMVKLQAQEKNLAAGSEELAQNQQRQIGFQTAASAAAARAGKSYEEAQQEISNYAKAIMPAVESLVRLEGEQARLVDSGEQTTESFRRIGFQIQQTNQQIAETPQTAKSAGDALAEIDEVTNVFGGNVGSLKERFTQAKQGIELAKGGFTGLKGAIASTGIGVLILALGALYEYFTQTDEGAEDLAAGMAFLKGGISVVQGVVIGVGKALVSFVKDPVQGIKDLGSLIKENIENRFKAAIVIFEAFRDGDLTKLGDGIVQAATGITDATAKGAAFTAELKRAAAAAYDISRAEDALDDAQRESLVTLEKNKNLVDQLVLSARDRSLTEAQRLANLDRAGKLEEASLKLTTNLAKEKLRIVRLQNAEADRTGKLSDEQRQAAAEAEADVVRLAGQSATQQQAIQNRRAGLLEQEAQQRKANQDKLRALAEAADARELARLKDRNALQQAELDAQLRLVAAGSEEELSLLRQKLARQRELELTDRKLSADARKAVETKYRSDVEQLDREHLQQLREQAAESQQTAIAAQLARAREGSDEEFLLKTEAIQADLAAGLAAIDTRQSQEQQAAQADRLRAEATKAQADLEYQQALASLETYLAQQRTLTNQQYAAGQLTKEQHEAALAAIERAGGAARIVALQDYGRDATSEQEAQSQREVGAADRAKEHKKAIADQEIEIRLSVVGAAQDATDTVIGLFGEESAAGQVALAAKKTLALAEIAINLSRELSAIAAAAAGNPANVVTAGIAGISQSAILSGIAIAKAAFATAKVLAFADGGRVIGPGGPKDDLIPALLSNGEGVMTAQAMNMFGPLLSWMNMEAGGKSFGYKDPMPAATMARYAEGGVVRYDASYMAAMAGRSGSSEIDYEQLADAIASKVVPGFYQAAKALPAQNVNITELREKQDKQARNEARGNI